MQNDAQDILEIIINSKTIAETLRKMFSGYYVTQHERKETIKATIDIVSKQIKAEAKTEQELQMINNQVMALKLLIDSIREVDC